MARYQWYPNRRDCKIGYFISCSNVFGIASEMKHTMIGALSRCLGVCRIRGYDAGTYRHETPVDNNVTNSKSQIAC